jgi:hypothetical protein
MSSDIDRILYPTVLESFRQDTPPVECIIWKGNEEYDKITFDKVYPFDTVEHIKRLICNKYRGDSKFIPRFLFIGIPSNIQNENEEPTMDTLYQPMEFLWYPMGSNDAKKAYFLKNPRKTLIEPDMRFVSEDGSYSSPNYELRDRSTIEQVFLKPRNGKLPVFHVFPFRFLYNDYKGQKPISEQEWNKKFSPYFPEIRIGGPYEPNDDDLEFADKIQYFIKQRLRSLDILNEYLESGIEVSRIKLSGVKQLLLTWIKQKKDFEGCASLFYRIPVTEERPFLRLLPSDGSPITKLHVKGILPIPSLDDPKVLEVWGKEISPTPGSDFCCLKYVHRPSIGITPPIYGSIQILNDGTMTLLLQPPKQIRKLDPEIDFRYFRNILEKVFNDLPQSFNDFGLRDLFSIFELKIGVKSPKFTKKRLMERLPFFQTFLKIITPLPDESPILSLRYKAVSQYASEDQVFSFITQTVTGKKLDGDAPDMGVINAIQNEFQLSKREALNRFSEWLQKRGTFTVQNPDEGDFVESYNPGIDIHIFAQHPSYFCHIHRIDSYETYQRIFTLLSLLFIEDDDYFKIDDQPEVEKLNEIEDDIEQNSLERDETELYSIQPDKSKKINKSLFNDPFENENAADLSVKGSMAPSQSSKATMVSSKLLNLIDDPFNEDEVIPETAPNPVKAATASSMAQSEIQSVKRKRVVAKELPPEMTMVKPVVEEKKEEIEQKLIDPKNWFIKKLKEIDPRLFGFKAGDEDDNPYSRKCAGYDDRQPSILDQNQYDRMREIYENDNIFWIVYPLEGTTDPIPPIGTEEIITILRYGSSPDSIHYYFCPLYYCLNDEIMVRQNDFESSEDRDGNPKPPNTCPFCYGGLITNRKKSTPGLTVIKRKNKVGSQYHHGIIDFMTKTSHPEGFFLPCCFLKQSSLRISDPQFSHIRSYLQQQDIDQHIAEEEVEEEPTNEVTEADYEELLYRTEETVEFAVLFELMYKKTILESNKSPDAGIFATAPAHYDTFFTQDSGKQIVTRVAVNLKLRPNAMGFLRIGTQNTIYESLLGVIAPLIYKNSIEEVKERILEVVVPRIFINSHFGNLVLEFYNPMDGRAMPQTSQALMTWSQKYLGIQLNSTNSYSLLRIYNSYKRFVQFINDPTQRKDLRHIQPLLAEPGLFTERGIQLIIMEEDDNNEIIIKCPTFGISRDRNQKNDFAFISKSMKKIGTTDNTYAKYELFIYTSNKPAKGGEGEVHETIVKWDYQSRAYWPEIVVKRIDEYLNQCQSRYRSIFTIQSGIDSMSLIPLSKAVEVFKTSKQTTIRPDGIIKDYYNHIVGVTFPYRPGSQLLVALPVVDDGVISILSAFVIKNIYLDWNDFKPAPIESVIEFYKNEIEPHFKLYPGYSIRNIVRNSITERIVAVQLENTIQIPVGQPKDQESLDRFGLPTETISDAEWSINKELVGLKDVDVEDWDEFIEGADSSKKCGTDVERMRTSTHHQLEELYQQFRIMVSNWLTSMRAGSEVRTDIEEIIFNNDLPEYERRKRLYIYLSTTLLSWFYPDPQEWEKGKGAFLRKDCRLMGTPDKCTGSCVWKEDPNNENSGKCLLHIPETTQLSENSDERVVSTSDLFTKRIIDELVRFPIRRNQLMKKGKISKLASIIEPIRDGDQYIIPESSSTWTDLLRLDWTKQIPEEKKYYEEMSRNEDEEDKIPPKGDMPPELYDIFGEDTTFRVNIVSLNSTDEPFSKFMDVLDVTFDDLKMDPTSKILSVDNLINYVKKSSKPIGIVNLTDDVEEGKEVQFVKPATGIFDKVTIFIIMPSEIGLLIEQDGDPTVTIENLPEVIRERWDSAGIVHLHKRKKPVAKQLDEASKVPIVIGVNPPVPTQLRRRPIITTIEEPQVPLVEAPIRVQPIIEDKPKRRRPVARNLPAIPEPLPLPVLQPTEVKRKRPVPKVAIAPESSSASSSNIVPSSTQTKRKRPVPKVGMEPIKESSGGKRNYTRKLIRKQIYQ